jgi:hypothetical protein
MIDDQSSRLRSHGGTESWPRVVASVAGLSALNLLRRVKRRTIEGVWRPAARPPDSALLMVTAPTRSPETFPFHLYTAPGTVQRHLGDASIGWSGRHDGPLTIRPLRSGDHFTCLTGDTGQELVTLIRDDLVRALSTPT